MYNFLMGWKKKTREFGETTTEILFSVAKTSELLLLLCPEEEIFEKFRCCALVLFSLSLEGTHNGWGRGWPDITILPHNYNICLNCNCIISIIHKRGRTERRCGSIRDDKLPLRTGCCWGMIVLLVFRITNFLVVLCWTVSNWFIYTSSWNLLSHSTADQYGTCPSALLIIKLRLWEFYIHTAAWLLMHTTVFLC